MDNFGENLFILLFRASAVMMIFFVTLCLVLWLLKAFQVDRELNHGPKNHGKKDLK